MKAFIYLLIFVSAPAFATSFYVQRVIRVGISSDQATAVSDLIRASVSELGHRLSGSRKSAEFVLESRLVKLGSAYVLSIEKKKNDKNFYSAKMKTKKYEELDTVVNVLVRSVIHEIEPQREASNLKLGDRVGEDAPTTAPNERTSAVGGTYVGFGPAKLDKLNNNGLAVYAAGGSAFDVGRAVIRVTGQFALSGKAIFSTAGIGANVFMIDSSAAPFVGLDFGVGFAKLDQGALFSGENVLGFQLTPQAGVHLFRTSEINMEIALFYSVILKSSSIGKPAVYGARVGIYY